MAESVIDPGEENFKKSLKVVKYFQITGHVEKRILRILYSYGKIFIGN